MILRRKKQIIVAIGLPINKKGQFLLTKRNDPGNQRAHHRWQITGGGVEFNETVEEALVREVREELGVFSKILWPYPIIRSSLWELKHADVQAFLICYIIDIGSAIIKPHTREIADFKWYDYEQIKDLEVLPQVHEFMDQAQELVKTLNLTSLLGK